VEVGDNMLVLITYDVSTQDSAGKKRLRKVAKECVNYGQRVQNSVFECILDASQALILKDKLISLIDKDKDSLRFYYLGNKYQTKIEHFGTKTTYEAEGTLMI
jgi:CRISPR-associated endoribonuclease cas2